MKKCMGQDGVRPMGLLSVAIVVVMLMQAPTTVTAKIDNVAFQWTNLLNTLICNQGAAPLTAGIQAQLHLAQWHALLALRATGSCTKEEAVVAYASFKILGHYFSWTQTLDLYIGPLLDRQLQALKLTEAQERLAQRLGEAVAVSMISKRSPAGEFTLGAVKKALNKNLNPATGVFRYFDDTPAGRAAAIFFFNTLILYRPFVVPHPIAFVKEFLSDLKPPVIPSREWDNNWNYLKDVGRIDWPGRTAEMNLKANLYACPRVNNSRCHFEQAATAAVQWSLPASTSLYDSVLLLAKTSVSIYDAGIMQVTIKYGYWFWRPEQAYRAGDATHAPIPNWTPFNPTPLEPEYPSGTVTIVSAGARPLQTFFGKGKKVAFTIEGGGTFSCAGFVGDPVPTRSYPSLEAFVKEAQEARLFAGSHFHKSTDDGVRIGNTVADYIEKHWTHTTPSGVLPDLTFLDIFAKVPKKSGDYSPIRIDI